MSLKTIFCLKCLAGALFTVVFAVAALVFPWAKLTVQVRDETGTPLSGAYVRLGFEMPNIHEMGTIFSRVEGKTDSNGLYDGAAECATGHVTAYATKAGYYTSSGVSVDLVRGTTDTYWSPWNATQLIVLKKIIDPVPMYARKRCVILLPAESGFVGFDLVASDWVAPYGKGTNADFLFKVTQHVVSDREFSSSLELKFSETGDGIQQLDPKSDIHSLLRSPQVAPLVGYVPNLVLSDSQKPAADVSSEYHTSQESDNYIFRVRTVRRSDGTILGACYGKIYGPIQYSISGRKYLGPNQPGNSVIFSYYLNPDENSRSLEFDLKRNLFKRLDSFDNPADP